MMLIYNVQSLNLIDICQDDVGMQYRDRETTCRNDEARIQMAMAGSEFAAGILTYTDMCVYTTCIYMYTYTYVFIYLCVHCICIYICILT